MKRMIMSVFTIFAVVASVSGATHAVFSDTETISGNTVSAANVNLNLHEIGDVETASNPVDADNLLPGEYSDWSYMGVTNEGSVQGDVYMNADNFQGNGGICANTNLVVEANSGSGWFEKYNGPLMDADTQMKLKAAPLNIGETLQVRQRVQLDSAAPNSAQGETCTWDEVFVLEGV